MANIDWSVIREQAMGPFQLSVLPSTLQLPALPHAVAAFLEKSRDEQTEIRELAAIVETDSGLTVELLRYANSSFIGLKTKVRSVVQALSLLGFRQSKLFVLTSGAQAAIRSRKSKLIHQASFWNTSFQRALFAREVAKLLGADEEGAFAGAVMQDFLLPVLTNDLFDRYAHFTNDRKAQPDGLDEYEQREFGWDHALIAAGLAVKWKLPDDLICGILLHHKGLRILADPVLRRTSVSAVAISSLLPDQIRQQYSGLDQLVLLETKWPAFKLAEIIQKVDAAHLAMGLGVRNDYPLSRICKTALQQSVVPELSQQVASQLPA